MSKILGSWNVVESGVVNLEISRQDGGHGIVALSGEQGLKFTCSVPLPLHICVEYELRSGADSNRLGWAELP